MNFFDQLRKIAASVALAYCERERRELDLQSAVIMKLGSNLKFVVRFTTMTPAGFMQVIFVDVAKENDQMIARHPFINQTAGFALKPYEERWFAPREPSQQDIAEAAMWRNHCKALGLSSEQMEEHLDTVRQQLFFKNE